MKSDVELKCLNTAQNVYLNKIQGHVLIKQRLFKMLSSQRKIRESKNSCHGEGGGGVYD